MKNNKAKKYESVQCLGTGYSEYLKDVTTAEVFSNMSSKSADKEVRSVP